MEEQTPDFAEFYIVDENDLDGEDARGPFSKLEAEMLLKQDEKIITREQFERMQIPAFMSKESPYQGKMQRDLRNWGIFLIIFGVLNIFSNGLLNSQWGVLLIIVGVASFFFKEVAMFVIYGATLSWASLSNLLTGEGAWIGASIIQAIFAFSTFRQFYKYRKMESERTETDIEFSEHKKRSRAEKIFPWASLILGIFSVVGFFSFILFVILVSMAVEVVPEALFSLEGFIIDLSILAFALGLASLLTGFEKRGASIVGMLGGLLIMLIEIVLFFVA